jgi:ATP-binding cassette subfamily B protein
VTAWHELRRSPSLTWAALRLVRQAAPRALAITTALQVAGAVLLGAQLLLAKHLAADLAPLQSGAHVDGWSLAPVFAALIVATVVAGTATAVVTQQQVIMADLVGHHTMDAIIDVASRVGLARYEDPAFHDQLERARSAALYRPVAIVNALTALLTALTGAAGISIALLAIQPVVLPLVLIAGVPVLAASLSNARRAYAFEFGMTTHAREHLHLMEVLTGPEYAKELRVFSATGTLRRRYDALTAERLRRLREFVRRRMVVAAIGNLAGGLGAAIALGALLWLVTTRRTDVATAATAALAMQLLSSRLQVVSGSVAKIVEGGLFLDDFHRFLAVSDETERSAGVADPAGPFAGLAVTGLSFTYPGTDRRVLDDVALEIRPGEVVALVGENGSGKTTLVKLLCRLYAEQEAGRITLNGRDLRDLDPAVVRAQLTVLFQDFVRYELSVADNIALGRPEGPADESRIVAAARRAGIDGAIRRLAGGYATRLGRRFDGGEELSGGQWQRLALARAFFRDGQLLILDEPTAALDPRAEAELFQQMRELAAGKSVLLISHRFSSVRMADRIYVLQAGRVVEHGSHDELLGLAGVYAELYGLQAAAYLDRSPER